METSILITIRKVLNLSDDDSTFDENLLLAINTALMILAQVGVASGTFLVDSTTQTWSDLVGTFSNVQGVKSYIMLKVRMEFDPPTTQALLDSTQRMITELEHRLAIEVEILPEEGE